MTKSVSYAACHERPAQPFRMPNPVSWVSGSLVGSYTWVHSGGWVVCGLGVRCVLLPAFGGDEPFRVGVGAFHVDDPFAAPSGVFVAQAAVGVELAFEVGIDAAFEPVGVVGRAVLLEVGEERACVRASCVPHCGH